MKVNMLTPITAILLLCLLLTAVACDYPEINFPLGTQPSTTPNTAPSEKESETCPDTHENTLSEITETETHPQIPVDTTFPMYPGDIDITLPELQEFFQIILSVKDGMVLGATSLDKPENSDIIDSLSTFESLYGAVEGIDEAFFETYALRLVYTDESSGSTRYAVESVTVEDGRLKVEIIEQYAAISTKDLRYWYVFAVVEKEHRELPVDIHITGIQLT